MKYLLKLSISFESDDDIGARRYARSRLFDLEANSNSDIKCKLQRVYDNKPPERLGLGDPYDSEE